jgi:CHASE3 domain sensor protein
LGLAAVVLLCASSVTGYLSSTWWVDRTLEVRQELDAWLGALLDAETGARGYIAEGEFARVDAVFAALLLTVLSPRSRR